MSDVAAFLCKHVKPAALVQSIRQELASVSALPHDARPQLRSELSRTKANLDRLQTDIQALLSAIRYDVRSAFAANTCSVFHRTAMPRSMHV
jgi:DNA-binding NarL/FixJ family response regulator